MADDGMLLNFSIPDSGIIAKPTFKGGNWKSRLTAKKAAQNWHTKATARLNGEAVPKKTVENATNVNRIELGPRKARVSKSPEFHDSGDRPVKRARVSGDFRPRTTEKTDKMTLSPKSLAGPGYIILNGIRVMNIIGFLAVITASVVMLVKIDTDTHLFFFDAVSHVITLITSSKSKLQPDSETTADHE